jgi:hypothetical protein
MDVAKLIAIGCLHRALHFLETRSRRTSELHECTIWLDFADMAAANTLEVLIEGIRSEAMRGADRGRKARALKVLSEQRASEEEHVPRSRDFSLCEPCRRRDCLACDGGDCRCTCALVMDVRMRRVPREVPA